MSRASVSGLIATASADGEIAIWDHTWNRLASGVSSSPISHIAWSHDTSVIATFGRASGSTSLWLVQRLLPPTTPTKSSLSSPRPSVPPTNTPPLSPGRQQTAPMLPASPARSSSPPPQLQQHQQQQQQFRLVKITSLRGRFLFGEFNTFQQLVAVKEEAASVASTPGDTAWVLVVLEPSGATLLRKQLQGSEEVTALARGPSGGIAIARANRTVEMYDEGTLEHQWSIPTSPGVGRIECLGWLNASTLLVPSDDATLRAYRKGKLLREVALDDREISPAGPAANGVRFAGVGGAVLSLKPVGDMSRVYVVSAERLRVFDIGNTVSTSTDTVAHVVADVDIEFNAAAFIAAEFSPDGERIATLDDKRKLAVWRVDTASVVRPHFEVDLAAKSATCFSWLAGTGEILIGADDGVIYAWSEGLDGGVIPLASIADAITAVVGGVATGERLFAVISRRGFLAVFQRVVDKSCPLGAKLRWCIPANAQMAAWSPTGESIAVAVSAGDGSLESSIEIYSVDSAKKVIGWSCLLGTMPFASLLWMHDVIMTCGEEGVGAKLFRADKGSLISEFGSVTSGAPSRCAVLVGQSMTDHYYGILGTYDGRLLAYVVDATAGPGTKAASAGEVMLNTASIESIRWHPKTNRIAVVSLDCTVNVLQISAIGSNQPV